MSGRIFLHSDTPAKGSIMRKMLHWIDSVVDAQPFYPDEIMVIRMAIAALRFRYR